MQIGRWTRTIKKRWLENPGRVMPAKLYVFGAMGAVQL
jgi:hypothetical protein